MGGSGKGVTESLLLWLEDEDEDKNGDNATFEPDDWTRVGTNKATTPQQVRLSVVSFSRLSAVCLSAADAVARCLLSVPAAAVRCC